MSFSGKEVADHGCPAQRQAAGNSKAPIGPRVVQNLVLLSLPSFDALVHLFKFYSLTVCGAGANAAIILAASSLRLQALTAYFCR